MSCVASSLGLARSKSRSPSNKSHLSLVAIIMDESGLDAFDYKLLASIFLLTEGKDVARLRLVCKGWQENIDDSEVGKSRNQLVCWPAFAV